MSLYTITSDTIKAALARDRKLKERHLWPPIMWGKKGVQRDYTRLRFVNGTVSEFVLPAKRLQQWLATMSMAAVEFPPTNNGCRHEPRFWSRFCSGNGREYPDVHTEMQLFGLEPVTMFGAKNAEQFTVDHFPAIELVAPADGGEFKLAAGKTDENEDVFEVVARFCTKDPTRFVLQHVHVEAGTDCVATDGRAMLVVEGDFGPTRDLSMKSLLPNPDAGSFPTYHNVIPTDLPFVAEFDTDDAELVLRKTLKMSNAETVRIGHTGRRLGQLHTEWKKPDEGTGNYNGKPTDWVEGYWNPDYLHRAFKAFADLGESKAQLHHSDALTPMLLVAGRCKAVIMPKRVS